MTNLKKWIIRSAIALTLLVGGLLAAGYFLIYVPYAAPLVHLLMTGPLEDTISNTDLFHPGASGELSDRQVQAFFEIEQKVQVELGSRFPILQQQRARLEQLNRDPAGALTLHETIAAFGAIGRAYVRAKKVQVDALNAAGFSKNEYVWVRERVYEAAGLDLSLLDLDGLLAALEEGGRDVRIRRKPAGAGASSSNKLLVTGRESTLEEWRALAFFGL